MLFGARTIRLKYLRMLEKVQRCAARWVLSDYSYHISVTAMLHQLKWQPLAARRKHQRLNLFYQVIHGLVGLSLPDYIDFTSRSTRNHHPFHLVLPSTSTTTYMSSFFPRTIREWNSLPISLIELNSLATFSNMITDNL